MGITRRTTAFIICSIPKAETAQMLTPALLRPRLFHSNQRVAPKNALRRNAVMASAMTGKTVVVTGAGQVGKLVKRLSSSAARARSHFQLNVDCMQRAWLLEPRRAGVAGLPGLTSCFKSSCACIQALTSARNQPSWLHHYFFTCCRVSAWNLQISCCRKATQ